MLKATKKKQPAAKKSELKLVSHRELEFVVGGLDSGGFPILGVKVQVPEIGPDGKE
jgi:hypothetical protein